jgi:xanthine dehydrogenase YagS FAD-binding subunit
VIDISRLPLDAVTYDGTMLSIGALAKLSAVSAHPDVLQHHPLIAEALLGSASAQVRNMATVGGNLLQRTRCLYFRDAGMPCNKRNPGAGCGARNGQNRNAAIFHGGPACVATHASDLAVALTALNAMVAVKGPSGARHLSIHELYPMPGATEAPDTSLAPGEIVTEIHVSGAASFAPRSTYLKIRDRASFEFAVMSVAAAVRLENGLISEARLAAGGVAPRPWRLHKSEAALVGRPPSPEAFSAAAELAIAGSEPLANNGFKVPLLRNAVVRALETIGGPL